MAGFFPNVLTWQNRKCSTLYFSNCLEILLVGKIQTGTPNEHSPACIPHGEEKSGETESGTSHAPPHPESVGICYLGKEVMDFFSLSLKAASVFSIGEGRPSCSHSSFLTGSAVYDLAQNSRKHPKILMHGDIKQHSHKPAAPHFHRDPGIHKGEGQARAWVLRTRVPSLHVCLSIIAMQV